VAEIESESILGATRLAMRRAIEAALALGQIHKHPPDPLFSLHEPVTLAAGQCITDWKILVDGRPMRGLGFTHRAIVEGDAKSLAIAMGSIVAKVTRDRLMEALDVEVGGYGFAKHKGYATAAHRDALVSLGASTHHRSLFVRTFLDRGEDPTQAMFAFEDDDAAEEKSDVVEVLENAAVDSPPPQPSAVEVAPTVKIVATP
jgi:ribonuclease HII